MRDSLIRRCRHLLLLLVPLTMSACSGPAEAQPVTGERAPDDSQAVMPDQNTPYQYFGGLELDPGIPSPDELLGYRIGDRFTRHDRMLSYLSTIASMSGRVELTSYGKTHQGRPLVYLTISSPRNLADLDDILAANRELADPDISDARVREIIDTNPAIMWLSYNVHGNEASASEAAIQVAYTMASAMNDEVASILDQVVLVIDPCLNPDGRERYVSWYQNTRGVAPDPNPDSAEHDEPWPGGRTNHYLFDLNRDWVWLVHPESRSRLAAYREYLPQLHIDYHEQGHYSPYFFGAGDDPYNQNIPEETREWVERYGEANAEVFDEQGIIYATKERFDYLYPGYGKVLPVYHGAVGMLTEKGGHSQGGLARENYENHHTLTLQERAYHHFLTSMSYIESTAAWREGQLERFREFFVGSMEAPDDAWGFVISSNNDPVVLQGTFDLCRAHGIDVHVTGEDQIVDGLIDYELGETQDSVLVPSQSLVIRSGQPMGRLARALFERDPIVTDIDTYDITAWSLPVAFGLEAYTATQAIPTEDEPVDDWDYSAGRAVGNGGVAIIVDSAQHWFPVGVGLAVKHDLFARRAGEAIEIQGQQFERGSMIIHEIRNQDQDLEAFLDDCAAANVRAVRVSTGMTTSGPVLGTNENRAMTMPKVMLAYGPGTSSYSAGQHWHMLDIGSPVPHSRVYVDGLSRASWNDYTVLVLPSGVSLNSSTTERVADWVRAGGTVVATGSSAQWASRSLLELEAEEADEEEQPLNELSYAERRQRSIENRVPGAMMRVTVDTTHPLTAGVGEWLGVIKRDARSLPVADNGYVIARYDGRVGGSISDDNIEALRGKAFMTQHSLGRGDVICIADDVTIRGFHHAGMRLLMNAIVLGPTE